MHMIIDHIPSYFYNRITKHWDNESSVHELEDRRLLLHLCLSREWTERKSLKKTPKLGLNKLVQCRRIYSMKCLCNIENNKAKFHSVFFARCLQNYIQITYSTLKWKGKFKNQRRKRLPTSILRGKTGSWSESLRRNQPPWPETLTCCIAKFSDVMRKNVNLNPIMKQRQIVKCTETWR